MKLPSLTSAEGLGTLDQFLLDRSFVSGYAPTKADLTVLRHLLGQKASLEPYTNIVRWSQTLKSYTSEEQGRFPAGEPIEIDLVMNSSDGSEVEGLVLFFLVLHSMRHFVLSLFSPLSLATLIYY